MDGKGVIIEYDFNEAGKRDIKSIPVPDQIETDFGFQGVVRIFRISDWGKILEKLYPSYIIEDCTSFGGGHPDYKITKQGYDNDVIYIECKQNGDGLRANQIEWIFSAVKEGKKVRVMFFKSEDDE